MQNTQIESLKQQLQGISTQFENMKESFEQHVTELETKVCELNMHNEELKSEIKALKLKWSLRGHISIELVDQEKMNIMWSKQ